MFKKPKRNFRGRRKDSESGDENSKQDENVSEALEEETPVIGSDALKKLKKKKKDKDKDKTQTEKTTTILSFDHEEHDADAEFKIKKSSHSKKIAKQLKRELQKEKEEKERQEKLKKDVNRSPPAPSRNYSSDTLKAMIKAQNEMNGAVVIDSQEVEKEPEREEGKKFNKTEADLSKCYGAIPDAATIHAIRKKRQMARENQDFIPIGDEDKVENEKSRLVREEDHDHSEDDEEEEGRIAMGVNKKDAQLRHMHQKILQAREEDNSGSDHDWEEQQIRKGAHVRGKGTSSHANNGKEQQQQQQPNYSNQVTDMEVDVIPNTDLPPVTMENIISRLKAALLDATEVHRVHVHERDDIASRLESCQTDIQEHSHGDAEKIGTKQRLNEKYAFFQQTRGYVQDLVECINHKFPAIEHLEGRMFKQYQKIAEQHVKRRQQDIKDEQQDIQQMSRPAGSVIPPMEPVKQKRIAERGARRARRKQRRADNKDHEDGMSTDDELTPSEISSGNAEKERLTLEARRLFEDVVDDFHELGPIMDRFQRWKKEHSDTYEEAYIGLCLPKLFSPLIRLRLIAWNPLERDCDKFESSTWYVTLMFYGQQANTPLNRHDTDVKLMPSIIEKVLLPKITAFAESIWDPLSQEQTARLIALTQHLIADYPTISSDSKLTKAFIKAVMERMRKTLDEDIFVPLFPKQMLEANKVAMQFFKRQFWQCFKLLSNSLKWHGILADKPLQELAFDGLLNRYIILALHNSPIDQNTINVCQKLLSTIPTAWYVSEEAGEGEPIPGLQSLARYFLSAANTLDTTALGKGEYKRKECRDQIKQVAKMLIQIHATNHAQQLSEKYSFSLKQL